jgi:uncharacterized protein YqfA (UPF0365 family)
MDIVKIVVFILFIIGFFIFFSFLPIRLWLDARFARVNISIVDLIGMRIRRVPPKLILQAQISAKKAGLDISTNDLEIHYLAGGNVQQVVNALILADKAGIRLPFKTATAIDLMGRDVLEVVQKSSKHEGDVITKDVKGERVIDIKDARIVVRKIDETGIETKEQM